MERRETVVARGPSALFLIRNTKFCSLASNGEDRNSVCPGASNGGLVIS